MTFQHLPVYRNWKDRAPTGGPKPEAYQTVVNMREHGFPDRVGQAFLQTADTLKSAILTRVPGKAATGLIDDGYCLKSFFIHAKSCDWGPMAGFVAFFPALNKKGVDNISFNLKEHLATKKKFVDLPDKTAASPFVPLGLTERAAKRLENDLKTNKYFYKEINSKLTIGIIYDPGKSVLLEYLLQLQPANFPEYPEEEILYAFHRNIFIKRVNDSPYENYVSESAPGQLIFNKLEEQTLPIPPTNLSPILSEEMKKIMDDSFTAGWQNLHAIDSSIPVPTFSVIKGFYPILVAQNPYLTYGEGDPRNAITGDYDLFSVWPLAPSNRFEETIRLSEGKIEQPPPPELFGGALFAPILGKKMSLQLIYTSNVYVEVIPGFRQIKGLEDDILGNINDAVYLAAGLLNSLVYKQYGKKPTVPNVAFHSDEGGRPEVFEIEFPLAAFLPSGVSLPAEPPGKGYVTKEPRGLVITNASEFMTLVELLEGQANIPLTYGWLMHLLILVAENGTLDTISKEASGDKDPKRGAKRIKYLKARQDERMKFKDNWLKILRAQVWGLLSGYDIDVENVIEMEEVKRAMDQAARVFFSLLYADEEVYQMMIKIRDITMSQ